MSSKRQRPAPFPPGTQLGQHFCIEGLVRLSEGRMFYLANDDRPDQPDRHCFSCASSESPRSASHCVGCNAELNGQRFLVSGRWDDSLFEDYAAYAAKKLQHPGLIPVVDVFEQDGVQCSISRWNGEALLVDEGSPLDHDQLLNLTVRSIGLLAFLQHNGIELSRLSPANFVKPKSGEFMLFDVDVAHIAPGPLPPERAMPSVAHLAQLLRRFTAVKEHALQTVFHDAETGAYTRPIDLGREVEAILRSEPEEDNLFDNTHVAAMTDVGLLRVLNEDNWGWAQLSDDVFLYVTADGMGGHECGEVASEMAVDTICRVAQERIGGMNDVPSPETLENVLDEAFQSANNTIKEHSEQMGNDMGTTLTAAAIYKDSLALVANVGDSRAYLIREQVLHQITRDHSLVARMVEQNRLTPEEARNHPHSNILLRTVGTERNVEIDIFSVELEKGDRLLLCSDGLWGEIEDQDIEAILNHYTDPRVVCREMIRAAHHGGGRDNITVVLVEVP